MIRIRKITAILAATLMAFTTIACRQASAPSPEPTTSGGTDKLTSYYATLASLQDVVSGLQEDATIIMTGTVTASDITTISNIIYDYNSNTPQQHNITLNLKNVTGLYSIPDNGFYLCSRLQALVLPDTVTSIGDSAFMYCSRLRTINIPDSVTTIGNQAFYECYNLTTINIPALVTSIGSLAFYECDGLTKITVDSNNQNYCNDQYGVLFDKNKETLIKYPPKREGDYTIPNTVKTVSVYAFHNCRNLTGITFPTILTSIGNYAFYNCSKLTTVVIPNNITTINQGTFSSCSGLTSVTLPGSLLSIRDLAFYSCSKLPDISIPATVTNIGSYAFNGCKSFTTISIPASVTTIGNGVFNSCDALTAISVDSNNQDYVNDENGVLYNKGKTTLMKCPDTKTGSYTIPTTVSSIDAYAFYYCKGLTNITVPASVTNIGNYAFAYCQGLTNLSIPGALTAISYETFSGCTGLTSFTIPDTVTQIGNSAFYGCSSLTDITIPALVTKIGCGTFCDCTNLTAITFTNTSNWKVTTDYNYTGGETAVLTDPATNATNFKTTNCWYYWYKE